MGEVWESQEYPPPDSRLDELADRQAGENADTSGIIVTDRPIKVWLEVDVIHAQGVPVPLDKLGPAIAAAVKRLLDSTDEWDGVAAEQMAAQPNPDMSGYETGDVRWIDTRDGAPDGP